MFVHTGDYFVQNDDSSLRTTTYYTFTPRPLMDGGFYTMTDNLASLLAAAHRSVGTLEGIFLPFCELEPLLELMIIKESYFNRMIDYPSIDLCSAFMGRGLGKTDDKITNIESTYHSLFEMTPHRMTCEDVARSAMLGSQSTRILRTRDTQTFLTKSISNYRQYNPTAPKDIYSAMNDLKRYAELEEVDALIKAAMCHYQFEMIHPYECYNGIIGRLLVYRMLLDAGLRGVRYLCLSECLYNHRTEYFDKIGSTQKNGDYSKWIEFFIRIVYEAAQNGIRSVQDYIDIIRFDREKLAESKNNLHHLIDVYNYYRKNVVSSINRASAQLQLTFNVTSRAIEFLQNLGILVQVTEQSRNRLFAHSNLMRLLQSERA